jgi:hypothetical protein
LRIGDERRWWNRKITFPTKPVLLTGAILIVVSLGYVYFAPVVESWVWSLTHHSRASFKGWPGTQYESYGVKVPWMWRQEEDVPSGGLREITIVRPKLGEVAPIESIVIAKLPEGSPGLSESFTQSLIERLAKSGLPRFSMEPFPLDADIASRYKCMRMHLAESSFSSVKCASITGGQWSVEYFGDFTNVRDLNVVLRNLQ